jgi:hypothetical protein
VRAAGACCVLTSGRAPHAATLARTLALSNYINTTTPTHPPTHPHTHTHPYTHPPTHTPTHTRTQAHARPYLHVAVARKPLLLGSVVPQPREHQVKRGLAYRRTRYGAQQAVRRRLQQQRGAAGLLVKVRAREAGVGRQVAACVCVCACVRVCVCVWGGRRCVCEWCMVCVCGVCGVYGVFVVCVLCVAGKGCACCEVVRFVRACCEVRMCVCACCGVRGRWRCVVSHSACA